MNKIFFTVMSLFPVLAHAHGDHGVSLFGNLWHVLSNPEHIWPLTAGIVLGVILLVRQRL